MATRTGDTAPVAELGKCPSSEQADSTPHIVEVGCIVGPEGSTGQRPKAGTPTLADGIWQCQLITTARVEYAIKIAYGKEVTSNEKCISKPMLADYGVAPNQVNLRQAYA